MRIHLISKVPLLVSPFHQETSYGKNNINLIEQFVNDLLYLGNIAVVTGSVIHSNVQISLPPVLSEIHFPGLHHNRSLKSTTTPNQLINWLIYLCLHLQDKIACGIHRAILCITSTPLGRTLKELLMKSWRMRGQVSRVLVKQGCKFWKCQLTHSGVARLVHRRNLFQKKLLLE